MTHEELLANLTPTQERGFPSNPISVLTALRAVVELHKPITSTAFPEFLGFCLTCTPSSLNFYEATRYPCPTIQAIEKELV